MSNAISQRVADFLKEYQPFNFLSYDDLIKIATTIRVVNLEKNKTYFKLMMFYTIVFM